MSDGTLIASLPHQEAMMGELAAVLHSERLPSKNSEIVDIRHVDTDGHLVNLAVGRLKSYPLLLSVTENEDMALASWRETAIPIAIGGIFVSIFTAMTAVFLIGKLRSREALANALLAANGLYQHTVNSVMDAIVAVDASARIVLFNPAAEHMFGLVASAVKGKHFEILLPEHARANHAVHMQRFASKESDLMVKAPQMEITGRRANGDEFPIESTVSKSIVGGRLQMTAVLRDVTDRRRSQNELTQLNVQLRQLTSSLQMVREQERKRLSRELHDELGQQLTGLKLNLSWLSNRLRSGRQASVETIDEMRELIDRTIGSVRRISTELRPLSLEELNFEEAIELHCQEFAKRSEIELVLHVQGSRRVVEDELATALFRILQESLTNVAKHALATQVIVDLTDSETELVLTVSDNGKGMQHQAKSGGIGLLSMRERAISIGASFQVLNNLPQGTTIELVIPMHAVSTARTVS
jgi:PAS domain S-box-containing protein